MAGTPHPNEAIWRWIHTNLTLKYEGGFSNKSFDGHVTLFGVTAAKSAELLIAREKIPESVAPTIIDMTEKGFERIGRYVSANGANLNGISANDQAVLDSARTASYEMWRDTFLLKGDFDKISSPIMQGLVADTAFHAGANGIYDILARASGMPYSKDTKKDDIWQATVIGEFDALVRKSLPDAIKALGKAKEEYHLDKLASAERSFGAKTPKVLQIKGHQEGFTRRIYEGLPAVYSAFYPDAPPIEIPDPDRTRNGLPALVSLQLDRINPLVDNHAIKGVKLMDATHPQTAVKVSTTGIPDAKGMIKCLLAEKHAKVKGREKGEFGGVLQLLMDDYDPKSCGVEDEAQKQLAEKIFMDAAKPRPAKAAPQR